MGGGGGIKAGAAAPAASRASARGVGG